MNRAVVGRHDELRQIGLVSRVAHQRAVRHVVCIEAPAGYGKSTLLAEALRRLDDSTQIVRASPTALEAETSWSTLRMLIEDWAPDVIPIPVGVATGRIPGIAEPPQPPDVAYTWSTALRRLAEQGPTVVVIDDLQWCDLATAAVLTTAMREVPCLWLLAARTGESVIDVERLVPADDRSSILLGGLRRPELAQLLGGIGDGSFSPAQVKGIIDLSEGSPLVAVELARELLAGRTPAAAGKRPLCAVYAERLNAVSAQAHDVAGLAALAVQPTLDLLVAVLPDVDVESALVEIERVGLVHVVGGSVMFTHALARHAVLGQLGGLERAAFHRQLARHLDDPEERAQHLGHGSTRPDRDVATLLERTAQAARSRGAVSDASTMFIRAMELTPPEDADDHRRRQARAAIAVADTGDLRAAEQLMRGLLDATLDEQVFEELVGTMVMVAHGLHGSDGSEACVRRLLERVPSGPIRARLHRYLIRVHQHVDLRLAEQTALAALDDARRTGGVGDELGAAAALANVRFLRGEPVVLDRFVAADRPPCGPSSMSTTAFVQEMLAWDDRFEECRNLIAGLREQSLATASYAFVGELLGQASYVELRAGNIELAEQLADQAVEIIQPTTGIELFACAPTLLSIAGLRDDHQRVDELIEATLAEIEPRDPILQVLFFANAGFAKLSMGDAVAAQALLLDARRVASHLGLEDVRCVGWQADLAEAQILTGDLFGAAESVELLRGASERCGSLVVETDHRRVLGLLQLARGETELAIESLAAAADLAPTTHRPLVIARTVAAFGTSLRRGGKRRQARERLNEAQRLFSQLGASAWTARVDDELRRTGRGGATDDVVTALTPTERQIAELVRLGRSNREVAAELYVSIRTVESNLTRVYRKVGVRGRTELAAAAQL